MSSSFSDNQHFESYVPVYDVAPEKWEDARAFLVEQLKQHANAINLRSIGFYLDEEVLTGKAFIPGSNNILDGGTSQTFRTILRKVVDVSPLVAGANVFQHGVNFDANLTSINMWVAATNSTTLNAITMTYPQLSVNGANININSPNAFDRAFFFWEYVQEN